MSDIRATITITIRGHCICRAMVGWALTTDGRHSTTPTGGYDRSLCPLHRPLDLLLLREATASTRLDRGDHDGHTIALYDTQEDQP